MSRTRKALFALLVLVIVCGGAEAALRLAGFRYRRVTTYLEFNYPRPGFLKAFFEIDPDLLYRIRPTVKQRGVDLTWQPAFDLKIRDSRLLGSKSPGVTRIVALGDSSTYGVNSEYPWPQQLQRLLDRESGAGRFEVLNLGVPGYTSFQGRRLLETRGMSLAPDAVIVYFGWNDHLLALGHADADQQVGSRRVVALRNLLGESRLYQALSWATSGSVVSTTLARGALRRVGPDAFATELASVAATARTLRARCFLCTYPTTLSLLRRHARPAPGWLIETHLGSGTLEELVRLQDQYNDVVRRTVASGAGHLIDLDAAFEKEGKEGLYDNPLQGDIIHPNARGYALIALLVRRALQEEGLLAAAPGP